MLLGGWVAVQLVSLRLAARAGRRRVAIALLAPLPLLFAATQIPAGVLLYLLVSSAFGLGSEARAAGHGAVPVPALAAA